MANLNCNSCNRKISSQCKYLRCTICSHVFHLTCLPLFSKDDYVLLNNPESHWSCIRCNSTIFPFNDNDDTDFTNIIRESKCSYSFSTTELEQYLFSPFEFENIETDDILNEIDPDSNFYNANSNGTLKQSKYYTIGSLNKTIDDSKINNVNLSIVHTNIRSSRKNLTNFTNLLSACNLEFNFIGLSETWLNALNADTQHIPDYTHIYETRTNKTGGGVSLYMKKHIQFNRRTDLQSPDPDFETVFVEVDKESINTEANVIMGVIYRSPGSDLKKFNLYINDILLQIKNESKLSYLMGDYNINLLNYQTHSLTNQFVDTFFAYSFSPLITNPTRVTEKSATLIDNIFTNHIQETNCVKGILYADITDHFPVFFIDSSSTSKNKPDYFYKRCYSEKNFQKFKESIISSDLDCIYSNSDAQVSMTLLHQLLCKSHNTAFPLKRFKNGYKNKKPWLTDALKMSIIRKNELYVKLKRHFSTDQDLFYKRYKSQLAKLLRTAERDYYLNKLQSEQGNIKKTWGILKEVINNKRKMLSQNKFSNNGVNITDGYEIATKFNEFFVNIGPDLASKIDDTGTNPITFLKGTFDNSMFLTPCSDIEVTEIINSLKLSTPGYDQITAKVLKVAQDIVSPLLSHVINNSLSSGIFPKELKIANVIPLYKAGDSSRFTNYRPVSLLSTVSKVFEKIFYKRLLEFLRKYNILYNLQFGFREGHSTQMALFVLLDKIIHALENNEFAVGVFLDFSKAFDTVDHNILLKKLNYYGIRGTPLAWINSYLSGRQQFTTYNGIQSDYKDIACGVPQGSILGPLLFLVYVNDLAFVSEKLYTIMFADDTNMFLTGESINELVNVLNIELQSIVVWLKANKLSLNIDKTHFMLFQPRRKSIATCNDVILDSHTISRVRDCKFLGVILDEKLSWKNHVFHIKNKVSKGIGILYKARANLNEKHMITLYHSLIYPYFNYCNSIWSYATKEVLNPLIIIQKFAVRCICYLKRRESTAPYFAKLNILKLNEIKLYNASLFMYNFYHGKVPAILSSFFQYNRSVHSYNTRQQPQFHVPRPKTNLSKNFIKYFGVNIWNSIYCKLNVNVKPSTFKKQLKIHLTKDY